MNCRRFCLAAMGAALISMAGSANQLLAQPRVSIGVNVQIPLLPQIVLPAPPSLVVVPGTNVYVAPDVQGDFVFYQGLWWRPYEGYWYSAPSYRGPWEYVDPEEVPRSVYDLPPNFRSTYRQYHRLNHQEVERNWRRWEREHHWDRDDRRHRDEYRGDRYDHRGDGQHMRNYREGNGAVVVPSQRGVQENIHRTPVRRGSEQQTYKKEQAPAKAVKKQEKRSHEKDQGGNIWENPHGSSGGPHRESVP